MSSNTHRRIFVNVLVNGNIYQEKVPIDIQEDDFVIKSYGLDHFLKEWLVINYRKIPSELLSYKIFDEVTDKQKDALRIIRDNLSGNPEFNDMSLDMEKLYLNIFNFGTIEIHAKDIVVKD